ncbi:MAG: glycosyl transferase family 2, partial [Chitinophagaceae bacterium]|nr:glycosyl transferase family 2 [Chitinophagaceae bacterium]
MAKDNRQIFQTANPTRWQRFKWGSRLLAFVLVIAVIAIIIGLRNAYVPDIPISQSASFKKILESTETKDSITKAYQGFRKFIDNKWAKGKGCGQKEAINLSTSDKFSDSLGIRAAFYVDWDPQAFFSLKRHVNKLNLVIPEWLFFDPKGDSMVVRRTKRGHDAIKAAGIAVMPMLTNNIDGNWD